MAKKTKKSSLKTKTVYVVVGYELYGNTPVTDYGPSKSAAIENFRDNYYAANIIGVVEVAVPAKDKVKDKTPVTKVTIKTEKE